MSTPRPSHEPWEIPRASGPERASEAPELPEIRCPVCDAGSLAWRRVPRLSRGLARIGGLFFWVGWILFAILCMLLLDMLTGGYAGPGETTLGLLSGLLSCLVVVVFGMLLALTKDILQCGTCRAIVPAS